MVDVSVTDVIGNAKVTDIIMCDINQHVLLRSNYFLRLWYSIMI